MITLAIGTLSLAALPTIMTFVNLAALQVPRPGPSGTRVAILIPARDEAVGIAACLTSALASTDVALQVIVLDDHSTAETALIVSQMAKADPRLNLAAAPPLPPGWSGKQHACHVLSQMTDAPNLIFLDADVRLAPDAAIRLCGALSDADLVSGVPRQIMGSVAELMIIPMINTLLLGYLPIALSRRDPRPALAAACGQMIAVRSEAYASAGGHADIRMSLHDGLTLPRLFRAAGLRTDLVAGAPLAACRMYEGWGAVVRGTTKNATEGLAKPIALPIWTVLLLGGHTLPWMLLGAALASNEQPIVVLAAAACSGPLVARLAQAIGCREPKRWVLLHPFAVVMLIMLQWIALMKALMGRPTTWRGRIYPGRG